jgi:hypothetical protein
MLAHYALKSLVDKTRVALSEHFSVGAHHVLEDAEQLMINPYF